MGQAQPALNDPIPGSSGPARGAGLNPGPGPGSGSGSGSSGRYELLPLVSNITGSLVVHLPPLDPGASPNRFLFVGRPNGSALQHADITTAVVDLGAGKLDYIHHPVPPFCAGPRLLRDGRVALVGGATEPGIRAVQLFDPSNDSYSLAGGNTTFMAYPRYYPTPHMQRDGKVVIVGGTLTDQEWRHDLIKESEVWDSLLPDAAPLVRPNPSPDFLKYAFPGWYPFVAMLPNGRALVWGAVGGAIYDESLSTKLLQLPKRPPGAPSSMHPYTAAVTLTARQPAELTRGRNEFSLLLFGGSKARDRGDIAHVASSKSHRLDMWECDSGDGGGGVARGGGGNSSSSSGGGGGSSNHTGGGGSSGGGICTGEWHEEDMLGLPRVMADAVLLPNGRVVIANGAQTGGAGFSSWPDTRGSAGHPARTALVYDPLKPLGRRFSLLANTSIARLYHAALCLEQGGAVLVAGSETSHDYPGDDHPAISRPRTKFEARLELLHPPEVAPGAERPLIVRAPATLEYGRPFSVAYSYVGGARRVAYGSLAAPCAVTHSRQMGHTVFVMQVAPNASAGASSTTLRIALMAPGEDSGALQGWYLLFLVDESGVYSRGVWLQLLAQKLPATPEAGSSQAAAPSSGGGGSSSSNGQEAESRGWAVVVGAAAGGGLLLLAALIVAVRARACVGRDRAEVTGGSTAGVYARLVALVPWPSGWQSKVLQGGEGGDEGEGAPLKGERDTAA